MSTTGDDTGRLIRTHDSNNGRRNRGQWVNVCATERDGEKVADVFVTVLVAAQILGCYFLSWPVPNRPYGLCGREATLNLKFCRGACCNRQTGT